MEILNIEYTQRMYFFVPYNLSPVQQGIQAGHAFGEFVYYNAKLPELKQFIKNDKTWIILNGGTTNDQVDSSGNFNGSLNQILYDLSNNDIIYSSFREPDLNDSLTAVCFLADEHVWDYKTYPYIDEFLKYFLNKNEYFTLFKYGPIQLKNIMTIYPDYYDLWEKSLGGPKNVFLRELIRNKKLA